MTRHKSRWGRSKTTDGYEVIALPIPVKRRLERIKRRGEPYYSVVIRLLDAHDNR